MADPRIGIGGAPTRPVTLPEAAAERKKFPVASGLTDYFPDALVAVSYVSHVGNEQHNPGQPLNWARGKSTDEADTLLRHFMQRGSLDADGIRHSAKMAWRALALLQKEIEAEASSSPQPIEHGADSLKTASTFGYCDDLAGGNRPHLRGLGCKNWMSVEDHWMSVEDHWHRRFSK